MQVQAHSHSRMLRHVHVHREKINRHMNLTDKSSKTNDLSKNRYSTANIEQGTESNTSHTTQKGRLEDSFHHFFFCVADSC